MDIIGVLRGWRMFDHVAHVSGAMYGVGYYMVGTQVWTACKNWAASLPSRELLDSSQLM